MVSKWIYCLCERIILLEMQILEKVAENDGD